LWLGRNYEDVCDTVREFVRPGIVIRTVINDFTFDGATRDPMQQGSRRADRLHGRDHSRAG
jgi:putative DNA-invertase from lambdoid prophage Rac